jgi:hypothetical protein
MAPFAPNGGPMALLTPSTGDQDCHLQPLVPMATYGSIFAVGYNGGTLMVTVAPMEPLASMVIMATMMIHWRQWHQWCNSIITICRHLMDVEVRVTITANDDNGANGTIG